ncbi:unnamed protein product [Durusdinium trenchii]|uniref:C3H1-type domain-containing protein n=1 Tax=Durusdinium trenchii TaxID=1381693 RepID=A0ABP0ID58_9DINO
MHDVPAGVPQGPRGGAHRRARVKPGKATPVVSPLWKTRMCEFWKANKCQKGEACSYAHGEADLRPSPDFERTSVCPAFLHHGRCDKPHCRYAHSVEELRVAPNLLKSKMCSFYLSGRCVVGKACRFAHGAEELEEATAVLSKAAPQVAPLVAAHPLEAGPQPLGLAAPALLVPLLEVQEVGGRDPMTKVPKFDRSPSSSKEKFGKFPSCGGGPLFECTDMHGAQSFTSQFLLSCSWSSVAACLLQRWCLAEKIQNAGRCISLLRRSRDRLPRLPRVPWGLSPKAGQSDGRCAGTACGDLVGTASQLQILLATFGFRSGFAMLCEGYGMVRGPSHRWFASAIGARGGVTRRSLSTSAGAQEWTGTQIDSDSSGQTKTTVSRPYDETLKPMEPMKVVVAAAWADDLNDLKAGLRSVRASPEETGEALSSLKESKGPGQALNVARSALKQSIP